ncbi:hypothetical protein ACFLUS_00170 [Chloroflexota bacterium]
MKKLLISLVIAILLIVSFAVPAAAASQYWYCSADSYLAQPYSGIAANDLTTHNDDQVMNRGVAPTGGKETCYPSSTETVWYYADEPAEESISFGSDDWTAHLHARNAPGNLGTMTVDLYKVDSEGVCLKYGTDTADRTEVTGDFLYNFIISPVPSVDLSTGERIAMRISWDNSTPLSFYCNVSSEDRHIISPSGDPGYPVPELSTIILLSVGLVAIIVILYYRHRTVKVTSIDNNAISA